MRELFYVLQNLDDCGERDGEEATFICGKMDILEGQYIKLAEMILDKRVPDLRNHGVFQQRD